MFTAIFPLHGPSPIFHSRYKFLSAGGLRNYFEDGDCTIHHIAFLGIIKEEVIFVFVPCGYFSLFHRCTVKVASLFCDSQTTLTAKVVGKSFLPAQVSLCLMQLRPVNIGDAVRDNMAMKVILVLMDTNNILVFWEKFL